MPNLIHLIQENEYDPIEGRLEYVRDYLLKLYEHLMSEGMEEYAEVILDAFEGSDIAARAWQCYMYPETVVTAKKRMELYLSEKDKD